MSTTTLIESLGYVEICMPGLPGRAAIMEDFEGPICMHDGSPQGMHLALQLCWRDSRRRAVDAVLSSPVELAAGNFF